MLTFIHAFVVFLNRRVFPHSDVCCVLAGGGHGQGDQDQCERPVGGGVQREARPLPIHPRPAAGTAPSGRRELRDAAALLLWFGFLLRAWRGLVRSRRAFMNSRADPAAQDPMSDSCKALTLNGYYTPSLWAQLKPPKPDTCSVFTREDPNYSLVRIY